jgi:hypothetical protein
LAVMIFTVQSAASGRARSRISVPSIFTPIARLARPGPIVSAIF